eukprot:CAMPEP_0114995702 /NCGR_PEP_ID=MMETSP0216-20121206/13884_1 /TAXON_ID=223996 /ORGANISM="Protocruzia adherens, Strain Boccale" /LENGTH=278 /DNA_ID=CAMNT_0002359789 /DNA_START=141 /DNA_END=981 /DNA_ORIENTATION=-
MSHMNIKRYDCPHCDKRFLLKQYLKEHIYIHTGDYDCPHCDKRFLLKQYLKEHIYIHTGERPYLCPFLGCSKSFRQRGKLSIHKKKAHKPEDPRKSQESSDSESTSSSTTPTASSAVVKEEDVLRSALRSLSTYKSPSFLIESLMPGYLNSLPLMPVAVKPIYKYPPQVFSSGLLSSSPSSSLTTPSVSEAFYKYPPQLFSSGLLSSLPSSSLTTPSVSPSPWQEGSSSSNQLLALVQQALVNPEFRLGLAQLLLNSERNLDSAANIGVSGLGRHLIL